MNNFWPRRAEPEGFSIERLAKNARRRIAQASNENSEKALQRPAIVSRVSKTTKLEERFSPCLQDETQSNLHWANRNFDEYRVAA